MRNKVYACCASEVDDQPEQTQEVQLLGFPRGGAGPGASFLPSQGLSSNNVHQK